MILGKNDPQSLNRVILNFMLKRRWLLYKSTSILWLNFFDEANKLKN